MKSDHSETSVSCRSLQLYMLVTAEERHRHVLAVTCDRYCVYRYDRHADGGRVTGILFKTVTEKTSERKNDA